MGLIFISIFTDTHAEAAVRLDILRSQRYAFTSDSESSAKKHAETMKKAIKKQKEIDNQEKLSNIFNVSGPMKECEDKEPESELESLNIHRKI